MPKTLWTVFSLEQGATTKKHTHLSLIRQAVLQEIRQGILEDELQLGYYGTSADQGWKVRLGLLIFSKGGPPRSLYTLED